MSPARYNIGIAGAGVAGLNAGILLQQSGHAVQIFEARTVCGGRIQSQKVNGHLIEAGPEFIHGRAIETIKLLEKYKIPYVSVNGKMYNAYQGKIRETDDISEHWDKLLDQMQKLQSDLPFGKFLQTYFPGANYQELRDSASSFAQGFDLADLQKASTKALADEWQSWESAQFRIPKGYDTLVRSMENEFISAGGKILFGHIVKSVDWSEKIIRLDVENRQSFNLDKLMVCLPAPMLNHSTTNIQGLLFNPSPGEQLNIFAQIGYGTVVKLVMIWKTAFWKSKVPDAQLIFSAGSIPTWWTQYPLDIPVLTGWLGGPAVEKLSQKSDEFFLDQGFETLAAIFSISIADLKKELDDFRVFNWKKETWSRGAYSYPTVQSRQAKISDLKSWDRKIYFAGEAFYEGAHPGTVEAALISGIERATQLMAEI